MMKTLKLILASFFAAIMLFACSSDSDSDNPQSCEDATVAVVNAGQAFEAATPENYVTLCNNYKEALQDQIAACGDPTGGLQELVDGLNCTVPTTTGTLSMNLGSAPLSFDVITVTTTGTTRHVHGVKSNSTSYEINFDVEVGQTGANKINNFQLRVFSHTYTPMFPSAFGNDWESNITVNTNSSIVGTFHGELESATALNIQDLIGGVVDVDF